MRSQKREVYGANRTLSLKVNHLMDADVIRHIRNKKCARDKKRRQHQLLVQVSLAGTDCYVATRTQNSADAVDKSIECGL